MELNESEHETGKYKNDFKFYTLNDCTHYLENLSEEEALNLYMTILDYIIDQTK